MAAKPDPSLDSLMECPICLGPFDDPRILPCLHTLCRKCLEEHVSAHTTDGHFNCPSCQHACQLPKGGIGAVPKNFFLNSMKAVMKQQTDQPAAIGEPEQLRRECGHSRRAKTPHGDASVFCVDCAKFYCESCESSHMLFEEFRDHQATIPVSEVSPNTIKAAQSKKNIPRCPQHPAQQLDIYCDTCLAPVCMTCCLLQHKQHNHRELAEVGKESQGKLAELSQSADKHINKLNKHLHVLDVAEDNIELDCKKACQEVNQAADAIRHLVDKREEHLVKQIKDSEKVALAEVNASRKNTNLSKDSTENLRSHMEALQMSGDVTEQVIHTPGLETQLRQQETTPLTSVTWKAIFQKEIKSVAALGSMLGTVSVDQTVAKPSLGASGVDLKTLGSAVQVLKPRLVTYRQDKLPGLAVVGDCICAIGNGNPYLWIHNTSTQTDKRHTLHGVKTTGITAVDNSTLVITDKEHKKLHFITVNDENMYITKHLTKSLPFEPCGISVDSATGQLVIENRSDTQIVVCDSTGNIQIRIPVMIDVNVMSVVATGGGGYAVLHGSEKGKVHWVDKHGNVTHTYGEKAGEEIKGSWSMVLSRNGYQNYVDAEHMIQDSQGRLIVADGGNKRLHVIGTDRRLSHYLPIPGYPRHVCLDEHTTRLFVACYKVDDSYIAIDYIHVYKLPTTEPPPKVVATSTSSPSRTLHVQLNNYQ